MNIELIEQIAFGCKTIEEWNDKSKHCDIKDIVTFSGKYRYYAGGARHEPHDWMELKDQVGFLAFTHPGIEVEYLYYPVRDKTFHSLLGDNLCYLSHLGAHVDNVEDWIGRDMSLKGEASIAHQLVMDVTTTNHTNKYLQEIGRKYRYAIFDLRHTHGFYWKLIQRIEKRKS